MTRKEQINQLKSAWAESPRWKGITREYSAEDVVKLRGTVQVEHTLARLGSEKLWLLVNQEKPVCALGAVTGNQAIQEIEERKNQSDGLTGIPSGFTALDRNTSGFQRSDLYSSVYIHPSGYIWR